MNSGQSLLQIVRYMEKPKVTVQYPSSFLPCCSASSWLGIEGEYYPHLRGHVNLLIQVYCCNQLSNHPSRSTPIHNALRWDRSSRAVDVTVVPELRRHISFLALKHTYIEQHRAPAKHQQPTLQPLLPSNNGIDSRAWIELVI